MSTLKQQKDTGAISVWRYIQYLNFKLECLVAQEDLGLDIDVEAVEKHIQDLENQKTPVMESLKASMPKVPVYSIKTKPKVTHKKDGSLSSHGEKWFSLLRENKLPMTFDGEIKLVTGYEEPNPGSTPQVKAWLESLGWEPCTYKYNRDKQTGEEKAVAQVRYSSPSHPKKGELTESVLKLKTKEPGIEALEGITVINHRLSIFKGFLEQLQHRNTGEPFVIAGAHGFTNTLRFRHKVPVVNLPKVGKPWGEEIRSIIVSPKGHSFLGSDMVSLESTTKRHYMFPHDPEYVKEMSDPDFDEHLDLAVHAGVITKEQALAHVRKETNLKEIRDPYKATNYSAVYGVGPPKLARELTISLTKAKKLLSDYWDRNWAVKEVVKEQYVKTLKDGSMWLFNPVSEFYYSLRFEKDIFSTLNQSTGVYCFDTWVAFCRAAGVKIPMQYHDEILALSEDEQIEVTKQKLYKAIEKTNQKIKLNVPLAIDVQVGKNYAEVH